MPIISDVLNNEEDDIQLITTTTKTTTNNIQKKTSSILSISSSTSSKTAKIHKTVGFKRKSASDDIKSILYDKNTSTEVKRIKLPTISTKKLNGQDRVVSIEEEKILEISKTFSNFQNTNLNEFNENCIKDNTDISKEETEKLNNEKGQIKHLVTKNVINNKNSKRKRKNYNSLENNNTETILEKKSKNNDIDDDEKKLNEFNKKKATYPLSLTSLKTNEIVENKSINQERRFFRTEKNSKAISSFEIFSFTDTEEETEEQLNQSKSSLSLGNINNVSKELLITNNKKFEKKTQNNLVVQNTNNSNNKNLFKRLKKEESNSKRLLLTSSTNNNKENLEIKNNKLDESDKFDNIVNPQIKKSIRLLSNCEIKLKENNCCDKITAKRIELEKNSHKNIQKDQNGKNCKTTVFKIKENVNNNIINNCVIEDKTIKTNNNNNNIMSVYDRRIQADDRPPINGYTSNNSSNNTNARGLNHHHNEDNSSTTTTISHTNSIMSNHYYQCPPLPPPPPQPTMATLCNIGNTCYLNSVIYTLRFAPMFLHNLHHLIDDLSNIQQNIGKYNMKCSSLGRNISGIHMENTRSWSSKDLASLENVSCDMPKSSQQIATEKLHELYQNLHRNEYTETTEPFHAGTFLHAIQDVSAIFEGNQQQDAHEFLMCVLDSIRETCQSLIKAISECPDVITNGCISLPERKESQCAIVKEKPLQRDTGGSAILKNTFFSRKSKRKDAELKNSKNINSINSNNNSNSNNSSASSNNRIQSPHKDNTHYQMTPSSDGSRIGGNNSGGDTLNGSKHSLKCGTITSDNELTNIKDKKEHLSEKIKRLGLDFFTEDFEGITVSTTKCLSCETITEQKETMIDIAVPMTRYENMELGEKFIQDSCITKEYFRGENKYRCERCMGYTEAIRSISYEVLPRLLVIQLSRFSEVMEKINTYVPTPFTLQCFCSKCLGISSTSSSLSSSVTSENKNLHVYKLYSVITHVGATMSVGHYIAYTCSLDWANDYMNCPKDRMREAQLLKQQQQQQAAINTGGSNASNSNSLLNGPEKNVKLMKKIIFGRSKASSSGDMSKTVKNINGLSTSKSVGITTTTANGGIDKKQHQQEINSICPSINCCGLQIRNNYLLNNSNYNNTASGNIINNSNNSTNTGGYYIDLEDTHSQTSAYNSNYGSNSNSSSSGYGTNVMSQNLITTNSRNRNLQQQQNEPIWYMCDDDKIKAMSQREFEDMLSPNRKIMITPYLLFYARSDVQ